MRRTQLQALSREELIGEAERAGVPRPRVLTQAELIDEILKRTAGSEREKTRARGWLGRARDLIATVVEKGLHLPDAAAAIRSGPKGWPPPPPPLPTVTLAEIYAAQGHLERAVAVLDEVLRREPDHQEARELRERFVAQLARGPKSAPEPPVSSAADTEPSPAQKAAAEAGADPKIEANESGEKAEPAAASNDDGSDAPAGEEGAAKPSAAEIAAADRAVTKRVATLLGGAREEAADAVAVGTGVAMGDGVAIGKEDPEPTGGAKAAGVSAEVADDPPAEAPVARTAAAPSAEAPEDAEAADATKIAEAGASAVEDELAAIADVTPEAAAAALAAADIEPVMPLRYDVDEVVALAVDPSTFYVYWEVRPTTFAHMAARTPKGHLALRVTAVTPGWDGPIVETRDVAIDALHGDHFIHHVRPRADVRVSVGWIADGHFDPIAIGAEVSAPRAFVAAGSPAPAGAPLDLSEGPHGVPAGFARPVTFEDHPRGAALIASGWVPREIPGSSIEGAGDQAPEGAGAGPTSWIWVPGPISEQIGMNVMLGPSTADLPRAPALSRRQTRTGTWGGASESGPWSETTEEWGGADEWGGASERWGGASEATSR